MFWIIVFLLLFHCPRIRWFLERLWVVPVLFLCGVVSRSLSVVVWNRVISCCDFGSKKCNRVLPFSDSCPESWDEILLRGLVVTPLVLRACLAPRLIPKRKQIKIQVKLVSVKTVSGRSIKKNIMHSVNCMAWKMIFINKNKNTTFSLRNNFC
jgi:hypothetical protein